MGHTKFHCGMTILLFIVFMDFLVISCTSDESDSGPTGVTATSSPTALSTMMPELTATPLLTVTPTMTATPQATTTPTPESFITFLRSYGFNGPNVCVQQTDDGGFIAIGEGYECSIVKTDGEGTREWTQTYWGELGEITREYYCSCPCIEQTWYHEYIFPVAFERYSSPEYKRLIKADASGDLIWQTDVPFLTKFIQQTQDGGFIICGSSYLMKTDYYGQEY